VERDVLRHSGLIAASVISTSRVGFRMRSCLMPIRGWKTTSPQAAWKKMHPTS